jgi:hypothetical protein
MLALSLRGGATLFSGFCAGTIRRVLQTFEALTSFLMVRGAIGFQHFNNLVWIHLGWGSRRTFCLSPARSLGELWSVLNLSSRLGPKEGIRFAASRLDLVVETVALVAHLSRAILLGRKSNIVTVVVRWIEKGVGLCCLYKGRRNEDYER